MDDGLDEDAQVLPRLPGLVSFEADAQAGRSAVIERHLERELLLPALGDKGGRQAGQLILLGARGWGVEGGGWRGKVEERGDIDGEEVRGRTTHFSMNSPWKLNKKLFHLRGTISRSFSSFLSEEEKKKKEGLFLKRGGKKTKKKRVLEKKNYLDRLLFFTLFLPFAFSSAISIKWPVRFQEVIGEYGKHGAPGTQMY